MRWSGSKVTDANPDVRDWSRKYASKDNAGFFAEALEKLGKQKGIDAQGRMVVGFLGQRDIPGVSLRHAQAILRWDRRPSLWSHVFLVEQLADPVVDTPILEVPLYARSGVFPEPARNGVGLVRLGAYVDATVDANVALVAVHMDDDEVEAVFDAAHGYNRDRLRYDLWETLGSWQPYIWSRGEVPNPLSDAIPVPSAMYVQMAYEAIGLDLTPGASERHGSPEHIWNAVRWWYHALESAQGRKIRGYYVLRDPSCTLMNPPKVGESPPGPEPPDSNRSQG